jgi:hypothetical protein
MPKRHLLFGEFLYYSGAVSWNAFIKSIMWQRMQRPQVSTILLHQRFLQMPIGEYFVKKGHLKKYRINYLHEKLKKHNSSF